MGVDKEPACPICGRSASAIAFQYTSRPQVEADYRAFPDGIYFRRTYQCKSCAHYFSSFRWPERAVYEGQYVGATYGDLEGIRRSFSRVSSLPREGSDNAGRVDFIYKNLGSLLGASPENARVLDVGSGIGIFPFAMASAGFSCVALDPDPTACTHMRKDLGLEVIDGDFMAVDATSAFQLVTFNKVLEHVPDPISMLERSKKFLDSTSRAFVYVELPDGEVAAGESKEREEFTIDHLHVFSFASMAILASKAGFRVLRMERLREPSGKYTLRGFFTPRGETGK